MNLPFGLVSKKESIQKRREDEQELYRLGKILDEYQNALEEYSSTIKEYSDRLGYYEKNTKEKQLASAITSLDITYLKEQGDKNAEQLDAMAAALTDANTAVNSLDRNVVNRISELLLELQKQELNQSNQKHEEMLKAIDRLTRAVKRGRALRILLFILNLFSVGLCVFLVLYVLEIIPF